MRSVAGAVDHVCPPVRELSLERFESFDEHADDWDALALASRNIFSTREWASVWWRHFGEGRPLELTACMDDDRVAAILPLYLASSRPLRTLRFIGHGPSDELGFVCGPADVESVARALREALAEKRWRWQVLLAERLAGGHDWSGLLGGKVLGREESPVLRTGGRSWDEFLAGRSRNFRDQVRRRERKLGREHDVGYRLADRDSLEADFETLVGLHEARWGERSPAFVGPLRSFHLDFAATALERGWLRLWSLDVDGRTVAAWHGFRFGDVESYYQSGRDPSWDRDRVGFVLLTHTMREAFDDGMREYRLLRGGEAYKDRFATEDSGIETVAVARGLGRPAQALGPALRRALPGRVRRRLRGLVGRTVM
jgi:CelD/BcsL family acetyltransferase involved in cellulose biosynthesis